MMWGGEKKKKRRVEGFIFAERSGGKQFRKVFENKKPRRREERNNIFLSHRIKQCRSSINGVGEISD